MNERKVDFAVKRTRKLDPLENAMQLLFFLCGAVAVAFVLVITVYLVVSGLPAIQKVGLGNFLLGTTWDSANKTDPQYGILPFILTSIYGRVIWSSLICTYIGFFLFGLVCIALGIFISSLTEMPLLAILMSELAMLLLMLMDNLSVNSFLSSIPVLSDVLSWFSNQTKFYVFSQGLMRFSDLLGYFTEIVVFLIWTIISIEKRRWSRR